MAHNEINLKDKFGGIVNPGERHTSQRSWVNAGSLTAVVAAGQAPIDVDKRAHADIVALAAAKKVTYEPQEGTVAFEFRVRSDGTADDDLAIQFLAEAGEDRYTKIADIVCTQGTQEADDSAYFTDAMTATNNDWETTPRVVDAQAEYICRYILNTHGHTSFLWVCTNLQTATNIYIDVRRTA
jgi:hypothetical protein